MGTPKAEHLTDPATASETGRAEGKWIARAGRILDHVLPKRQGGELARTHKQEPAPERNGVDTGANGSTRNWIPFDEQRHRSDLRRADIVFGPDMFDPRTDNGDRPLTRAMLEGRSDVDPADLSKTVGEVFGEDISPAELRRITLENARSIDLRENPESDRSESAA
jgi:hypothetical protein